MHFPNMSMDFEKKFEYLPIADIGFTSASVVLSLLRFDLWYLAFAERN